MALVTVGNKMINTDSVLSVITRQRAHGGFAVDIKHTSNDGTTSINFASQREADDFVAQLSEKMAPK